MKNRLPLSRRDLEAREARELAPWAVKSRDSRGRQHPEPEHPARSAYQRDRDRIIHSGAFRRLEYKTQVFVNHEGDNYRTRLTHTLEVAQISRSIARMLCLNEDLAEAVALSHDLGHTPFGHSGEDALDEMMRESGGRFEHNLQSLRIVETLERRYAAFPGLNLTWEVREGIAKHTSTHDHPASGAFDPSLQPPLEAQLVEVADSIAYDSHDVDDGLASGILTEGALARIALFRRARAGVRGTDPKTRRHEVVRNLINLLVTDLVGETARTLARAKARSLADIRRHPERLVRSSPRMAAEAQALEEFLKGNFYSHPRVARMASKARRFVKDLFREFARDTALLPQDYQARIRTEPREPVIADYIAGMTDRYAQDEWMRLFMPYERV